MHSAVDNLVGEFCSLSSREKREQFIEYQQKLREAYQGERIFKLPISDRGLEQKGGELLERFFEEHPDMEEIYIHQGMLNEARGNTIKNTAGFDALLRGLVHTRQANRLRVLDLSEDIYSPEQLGHLTEQVLMNHPTFTTLVLATTGFTDRHLEAMLPYLSCPQLKRISLKGNSSLNGDKEVFERFVDKLLSDCPSIQFIDVSGNANIKAGSIAAKAFERLVTANNQVFVRIPQDQAVYQLAMRNHYQYFIPNQFTLMDIEFNKMQRQIEQLGKISELETMVRAHDARFTQIDALNEDILAAIRRQCLKQMLVERQLNSAQTDMDAFKASMRQTIEISIQTTQVHLSDLELRVEEVAGENADTKTSIIGLKRNLAQQADLIDGMDERVEAEFSRIRALFDSLTERMQTQWAELTSRLNLEEVDPDLSPAEQAYTKKFKYMLVQMHVVSMTACEGSLQLRSTGTAGTVAAILNILSNVAPGPMGGVALSAFAYLFQAVDEGLAKQRMEKITHLGSSPDEIANIAIHLSRRLLRCLTVAHHIKKGSLQKLLSATGEVFGFYGALFDAVQDNGVLITALRETTTIPELEKRAEQDAKLLLTAIVKEDVPQKDGNLDMHRLFLYAAPVLTLTDRLFAVLLQQFCASTHSEPSHIKIKPEKRQKFYGHIANSWHAHAEAVALRIEAEDKESFIQELATGFTNKRHADNTTGVFYVKTGQTLFAFNSHTSMRNQVLEPATIEAVLTTVLGGL